MSEPGTPPDQTSDSHGCTEAATTEQLWTDVVHWRRIAVERWADGFGERDEQIESLTKACAAMRKRQRRLRRRLEERKIEVTDLRDRIAVLEARLEVASTAESGRVVKSLRRVRQHLPGAESR